MLSINEDQIMSSSVLSQSKTLSKKTTKKNLGQFFTTNSSYILNGLEEFIVGKDVTDPFAGNQDLLNWAKKNNCLKAIGYDFDLKWVDDDMVFFNDSLNAPKQYKFICTNPPYLHKNKACNESKKLFFNNDNNEFEDLYQISLKACMNCDEGIVIVPLNFLCAENSQKIRQLFFTKFQILKLNIFSTRVFEDTSYNVIAFYFKKKDPFVEKIIIPTKIYPEEIELEIILDKKNNWQFGGDFINKIKQTKNDLGIYRLTQDNIELGDNEIKVSMQNISNQNHIKISNKTQELLNKNILFLRAIDSKNGKKIQLEDLRNYKISALIGKNTSRNMAHLIFKNTLSIDDQLKIMAIFNNELNENRKKYFSFFLTNFRDNNRKRISFDLAYKLINLIYNDNNSKQYRFF